MTTMANTRARPRMERPITRQNRTMGQETPKEAPILATFECEAATLGAMIIEGCFVREIRARVTERYFAHPRHRKLFAVICGMDDRGDMIDLITVGEFVRQAGMIDDFGGATWAGYLTSLVESCPCAANWPTYTARVREFANRRSLVALGEKLQQKAREPDADSAAIIQAAEAALTLLRQGAPAYEPTIQPR